MHELTPRFMDDLMRELDALAASDHASMEKAERLFRAWYLRRVFQRSGFNQCRAAKRLGVHRNTFRRQAVAAGIEIKSVKKFYQRSHCEPL